MKLGHMSLFCITILEKFIKATISEDLNITLPEFQTVILDNNERLTFRILFEELLTHQETLQRCIDYGGRLVQIMSQAKQDLFASLSQDMSGNGPYWIDLTNKHAANYSDLNGWTTENGQAVPIMYWASGHPRSDWHCASLNSYDNSRWKSRDCSFKGKGICEI